MLSRHPKGNLGDVPAEKASRWRRRSAERPGEIADAALVEFAAHGFAGARLTDIAARAGVSKAALYRYYPTKTDLFRAVLSAGEPPRLSEAIAGVSAEVPFDQALSWLLDGLSAAVERPGLRRLARMVVAESGNFPQLAELWRESIVEPAVKGLVDLIVRAQAAGEVRPGDPRLMAFSVVGPMLLAVLWSEVIEPAGGAPLNIAALAVEHKKTLLTGLLSTPRKPSL